MEYINLTNTQIDAHLDAVLRASGTGLRYYSMQKTIDDLRAAMRAAMTQAYNAGLKDQQP